MASADRGPGRRARRGLAHGDGPVHPAFAVAAPGLAPLIAEELRGCGVDVGPAEEAGVPFLADDAGLARVHLQSACASRILVRLGAFEARDFRALVSRARDLPWDRVIAPGAAVTVRVTAHKSRLYHTGAIAERIITAIGASVAGVHAATGAVADDGDDATADAGDGAPDAQLLVVRFERDRCVVSVDASGALLHRRGWRPAGARAPMRETLAAALLASCGWGAAMPLVDPFAGAGTIVIEAARRARRIAPGLDRTFAFERWPAFDARAVDDARAEARSRVRPSLAVPLVARDRDPGAIGALRANAARAGVADDIAADVALLDALDLRAIAPAGYVVTNPPYGVRLGDRAALGALWGRLGAAVRAGGTGWRLAVVDPGAAVSRELRLRMRPLLRTRNGGLPVSFVVSDVPVSHASSSDPSASDPSASDPSASDPSASDPSASDPSSSDPSASAGGDAPTGTHGRD